MAILSPPRTSTSGRAPVLSATIRFWIRVESLNRPPTLLTMASSFNSSSMTAPFEKTPDNGPQVSDRLAQVVVDHLVPILADVGQLGPRRRQPPLDGRLRLRFPVAQPPLQGLQGWGPQEHADRIRTL